MEEERTGGQEPQANGLSALLQPILRDESAGTGRVLHSLISAARRHLGMEVGFISEFQGGRRVMKIVDQDGRSPIIREGMSDPRQKSLCQRVVDGRVPQLIHDAQQLPDADELEAIRKLNVRSHVSVPIHVEGEVYGTFCAFSSAHKKSLNRRDVALMQAFADVAGGLLKNELAEQRALEEKRGRIRQVLQGEGLSMVWQPITDTVSGAVKGAESLARFSPEPKRPPNLWFQEAAEAGLAVELEMEAIRKGLELSGRLPEGVYVSVNASARAVLTGGIERIAGRHDLQRVVLEITEHDVVEDYKELERALVPVRAKGLRLAVDDVGAGYASFRHILKLRPDIIKLDMSLSRDIDADAGRRSLVAALVGFAGETRCRVVAEGVETEAELEMLHQLGVDSIQGYLRHKPMPADELLKLINCSR